MRNIRMLIQYEGTRYLGWQRQEASDSTIQGKLEKLLSQMCQEPIEVQGSGRTDAGVHAKGQVANFHTSCDLSTDEMLAYCNRYLPEDIAVIDIAEAPERFHSRLNAREKCYCYQVINSGIPDVFLRRYAVLTAEKLDVDAMRRAAAYFCGEHDFKGFTSNRRMKKSSVRRIEELSITKEGDLLRFTFRGDGFLYHMIRIIMGTLLEVGSGKRRPESMEALIQSGKRELAGPLAPAKGLTLMEVKY